MYNYQEDFWAAISGSDPKEMKIYMGGRQIGKSAMAQMWDQIYDNKEYYTLVSEGTVDNFSWYTVKCTSSISDWIKNQSKELWFEHISKDWKFYRNTFDVHEKLLTMLQLKYGDAKI